jgi:serine/threonine protein kinase
MRPGDVLAGRYRLVVLLHERSGGRFWRAWDDVLARHVAVHLIPVEDDRADLLKDAARRSATVHDPHLLRVLDTDVLDGFAYVVNEWGEGVSLNNLVVDGPLTPRRAAWMVAEVGAMIATAHASGVAHGRLIPENVLLDESGSVKVIGFAVDAALHGLPSGRAGADVVDLAGLLYTALTGKWTGVSDS